MSKEYFIVAETRNGSAAPHWADYFLPGQYAEGVIGSNFRSDGALEIETDEQAAEFEAERTACRVQFITRDKAAEFFDPTYPNEPVMRAMRRLGWVKETENEETGETEYSIADDK